MTILDLSVIEVAVALAGAALGLSLVGAVVVALTSTTTHKTDQARASLWVDLTAALERLHGQPDDDEARELVFRALEPGKRTDHGLQVVASIVGLHREHTELIDALGDERIDGRLAIAIAGGSRDAVRSGLELAGLLRRRETLPVVLMRCQDEDPEIRRVAIEALARLAPTTAVTHLLQRLSGLGPWAVELLATLLADGAHERWLTDAATVDNERPRSLVDLVNVLVDQTESSSGQRRRAAMDALGSIDHRLARVALERVEREMDALGDPARQPDTLEILERPAEALARLEREPDAVVRSRRAGDATLRVLEV